MGKSLLKVRQIDGLQATLSSLQTNISALQNQLGNSVRIYGNGFSTYPVNAELLDGIDLGKYDIIRLRIGNYPAHTFTLSNHQGEGEYGKEWYVFLYNGAGNTCTVKVEDSYSQQRTVSVKTAKSIVIAFTKTEDTKFMVNYIYNINDSELTQSSIDSVLNSYVPMYYSCTVADGADIFETVYNEMYWQYDLWKCNAKKIIIYVELTGTVNFTAQTRFLYRLFSVQPPLPGFEVILICKNTTSATRTVSYRSSGSAITIQAGNYNRLNYVYVNNKWMVQGSVPQYEATI